MRFEIEKNRKDWDSIIRSIVRDIIEQGSGNFDIDVTTASGWTINGSGRFSADITIDGDGYWEPMEVNVGKHSESLDDFAVSYADSETEVMVEGAELDELKAAFLEDLRISVNNI